MELKQFTRNIIFKCEIACEIFVREGSTLESITKPRVISIVIQEPVVYSTISVNPGLPVNLFFWFRLFWLNNQELIP